MEGKHLHAARVICICFSLFLSIFFLSRVTAIAGSAEGIDWLELQVQPDGAIATTDDVATPFQSTAEALRAFQENDLASPTLPGALQYLAAEPFGSSEYRSRRLIAELGAGAATATLVNTLLLDQNPDGGWGELPGYASTPLDTAFVLEALGRAGYLGDETGAALFYLSTHQRTDGGWSQDANESSVYATAQVLSAFSNYQGLYVLDSEITAAQDFVLARQVSGELWAETFESAVALIGLISTSSDLSAYSGNLSALRASQLADGSWESRVYTSALALRAIRLSEASPTHPGLASIGGVVVDGLTGLPLAGVTVDLTGEGSSQYVTGADGRFVFTDLVAGNYALILSLANYNTVTATTTVGAQQNVDFGTIQLLQGANATTGTIRGTVTDADSGAGFGGVTITVSSLAGTVQTDANGDFQVSNVPAGSLTILAEKEGYSSATGSADMTAGGLLVFSPALTPVTAPVTAVQGIVTDGNGGQTLAGVTINVTGASTATTTTDAAGSYRIENLSPGTTTIEAALAGYDSAVAVTTIATNTVVDFSPALYPDNTTPPGGNSAGVRGVVLDSTTNLPLSSVLVTATFGAETRSQTTGADGLFELGGFTETGGSIEFSLADYTGVTVSLELVPLEVLDIGQVRLRPDGVTQLLPDLVVQSVDLQAAANDSQSFRYSGELVAGVANTGTAAAGAGVMVIAFYDINGNGTYEVGGATFNDPGDIALGTATLASGVAAGAVQSVAIALDGNVPYRDAPVSVWVDSLETIAESSEQNNTATSASQCTVPTPPPGQLDPGLKWQWSGTAALPSINSVHGPVGIAQLSDDNGDGSIDTLDTPDLVFVAGGSSTSSSTTLLVAVSGDDGHELWSVNNTSSSHRSSVALGDIDGDGIVEIIAVGKSRGAIRAFEHDGTLKWNVPTGPSESTGGWVSDGVSIADIDQDGSPEIIHNRHVFNADGSLRWEGSGDYGGYGNRHHWGHISITADVDLDGPMEIIAGRTLYDVNGNIVWHRGDISRDGWNAVGNFDADEFAEIVLVSNSRVYLLEHTGDTIWGPVAIPGGGHGGAPTIADFDGDGEPEVGVAGANNYVVFETDGSVKWTSPTFDNSSAATGSSVFDFEGDGKAEVLYADERNFYIYDGETGAVLSTIHNTSITTIEAPAIADVDNDGQAEIVVTSNAYGSNPTPGVRVYESQSGSWVPTRSIWNQHSYHINNINDDGTVPQFEQPSWLTHNTYRLNTFLDRSALDNIDLTAGLVQVIESGIDQSLRISAIIGNAGQVTTPASVNVAFYEGDPDAGGILVGTVVLQPLAADSYRFAILENAALQGGQPVYVVVDPLDTFTECREDNNRAAIAAPDLKPDLTVTDIDRTGMTTDLLTQAVTGSVDAGIHNLGNLASGGPGELVVFYDANQSGGYEAAGDVLLGTLAVADLAVAVNDTSVFTIPVNGTLPFRDAAIHVWVDSQEQVVEFDETNNVGATASQCVSGTDGPHEPIYVADWEVGRPVTIAEGGHGSPAWSFSGGGYVAYQAGNVQSTTLTGEPLSEGVIEGTWYNSGNDNDGIGIVFGFQDVKHHYNFWADRDNAGCCGGNHRLVRYGDNTAQLYVAPGGWFHRTLMRYRLEFHPGKFTVTFMVDSTGHIIDSFTIRDDTYTSGLFGFWGGSQGGVTYRAWNVPQITGASADATISGLTLARNSDGEPDILRARVGNGGATPFSQPAIVSFHQGDPDAGGVLLGEVSVDALAPGQYRDVELSGFLTPLSGTADIYATIDLAEAISDCDRDNNLMVLPVAEAGQFGRIAVSTDTAVYPPSTDAPLQATALNTGVLPGSYTAVLQVEDAAGAIVATLPVHDLGELAAAAATAFSDAWNTANYLAGPYVLRGLLYGADGSLLDEAIAPFSIAHPDTEGPAVTLRTTTDKPLYHTSATVQIQDVVQNLTQSTLIEDALLRITVLDPNGLTIHGSDVTLGQLLPSTVRDLTDPLLLQDAPVGGYTVMGAVIDNPTGELLASDMAQFQVATDPGLIVSGSVVAAHATREAGEEQICTDSVINNGAVDLADLPVRQLFARLDEPLEVAGVESLQTVVAGSAVTLERTLQTTALEAGDYACILQASLDGEWTTLDTAIFTVTVPPINIEAMLATGNRGRVLVLVDTATNGGGAEQCSGIASMDLGLMFDPALSGAATATVELFSDSGALVDSELVDLATINGPVNTGGGTDGVDLQVASFTDSGAVLALDGTATTDGVLGTGYRVLTTITDGANVLALDSTVIPTSCTEPVFISDIYGGYQIRDLGLVDAANDPHGNADIPAPWYQQAFLEQLLTDAGWTYTITTNGSDFANGLRSGGYTSYLLLSEQVQLAVQVEEELREAVYRGEGLVVAGGHDQRNSQFEAALGIRVIGKHSNATGVDIAASGLHSGFASDFIFGEHTLRLALAGATAQGVFNFVAGSNVPADTASLVTYAYGGGKTVTAGFDLLAEATGAGAASPYAELLLGALAHVHPAGVTPYPGAVIPLELTLTNLGIATPGEVNLTLPAGVTVVDSGAAMPSSPTMLDWVFDLAEAGIETLRLWLRLPDTTAALTFSAEVLSGVVPDLLPHTTATLEVTMQPAATLADARATLAPIAADNGRDNAYRQAQTSLDRAQSELDGLAYGNALKELLKAAGHLAGIGEVDADAIRLQVDQVIRSVERLLQAG